MEAAFDHIALDYDEVFTDSHIGKYQRQCVWEYLDNKIFQGKTLSILELNCGTGTDAVFFGKQGHKVIATDISSEMLKITQEKVDDSNLRNSIRVVKCDIRNIGELFKDEKFDLIFSNFGGLNCINKQELENLSKKLFQLLLPGGKVVGVIMSKFCLWESLYFALKFNFNKIFRRCTNKPIQANIGNGASIQTWYYFPGEIKKIFSKHFKQKGSSPIGLTLPPSYLEHFFIKRTLWLSFLLKCEKYLNKWSIFSPVADHYLIELEKSYRIIELEIEFWSQNTEFSVVRIL